MNHTPEEKPKITDEGQIIRPEYEPITKDQGWLIILLLLVLIGLCAWNTFK
jgi:hypothetical protein